MENTCHGQQTWVTLGTQLTLHRHRLKMLNNLHCIQPYEWLDFLGGVTEHRLSSIYDNFYLKILFVPKMTHACRRRVKLILTAYKKNALCRKK